MKNLCYACALAASLTSCTTQGPAPAAKAESTSVVGSWQLIGYQCYCPPNTPVPNQRLALDSARHFQFFSNNQLFSTGTYSLGTGSACGTAVSSNALLQVAVATPNAYAPHGNYTLRGDTLVIDQCLAADGPRYTFRRIQ